MKDNREEHTARVEHLMEQLRAEHGTALRNCTATREDTRHLVERAKLQTAKRPKHPAR